MAWEKPGGLAAAQHGVCALILNSSIYFLFYSHEFLVINFRQRLPTSDTVLPAGTRETCRLRWNSGIIIVLIFFRN